MTSICSRIEERRGSRATVCRVYHGEQILARKERLKEIGFRNLPAHFWVSATRDEAKKLLTDCLSRDLEHDTEVVPAPEAEDLANGFLGQFGADAQFITNTLRFKAGIAGGSVGCEPITSALMDTGVLVEQGGIVGILWVGCER